MPSNSSEKINLAFNNGWMDEKQENYPQKDLQRENRTEAKAMALSVKANEFFSSEWSVSGMRYVLMSNTNWIRRIIWLLLVLFGFGFMLFQFYDRVGYYLKRPTAVDITVNQKPEIIFPTVTVCNENIASKARSDELDGMTNIIQNMYPAWPDNSFVPNFNDLAALDTYIHTTLNLTWDHIWDFMAPATSKKYIERCYFNGKDCMENFTKVATSLGFCLQFNGENYDFKSSQPGISKGLYLLLNTDQNNYLYAKSRSAGFRVLLHTKEDAPLVEDLGFKAGINTIHSVSMKLKTVTNLPVPYGNCSDTVNYNYNKCLNDCFHEYVLSECKCRYYFYKNFTDANACDPQEMYVCADVAAVRFNDENLQDKICNCPPQCNNNFYTYTLSTGTLSNYAAEGISKIICLNQHNNDCSDAEKTAVTLDLRTNYAEMEIFFNELLQEEVVTKASYDVLALFCDIGGALGLILGSTILTLFEFFDFVIVFLYRCIQLRLAKKIDNKKSTM